MGSTVEEIVEGASPLKDLTDNLEELVNCHVFMEERDATYTDENTGAEVKCKVYVAWLRGAVEVEGKKQATGVEMLVTEDKAECEKYVHAGLTVARLIARRAVTVALLLQRAGQLPIRKATQRVLNNFGNPVHPKTKQILGPSGMPIPSTPTLALPPSVKSRAPAPNAQQADAIKRFSENIGGDAT